MASYFDLGPDDVEEIHSKFDWGSGISNEAISTTLKTHPVVCYNYIDLDKTQYNFKQSCFDNTDIKAYFEGIKYISEHTLEELLDYSDREFHFHKSYINGNLRKALIRLNGNKRYMPEIYHFALYTNKQEKADRYKKIKSPRIYFLVGKHGMIYILFYDPYHEINP